MLMQGQVGPQATGMSLGVGLQPAVRLGNLGEQIISQLHPAMYEACYRNNLFSVCNQVGLTTTSALATTHTGLIVGNPTNSTVNIVLRSFSYSSPIANTTAGSIGLMTGTGASITGTLVARNRKVGSTGSAAALCSAGQVLPGTPVLEAVYASYGTLATTGTGAGQNNLINLDGSIILPPGAFVATYTTLASTSSFQFAFVWEEVPT